MKQLWYRVLVGFYRLMGSTPTQAEWRARRALKAPDRVKADVEQHLERAKDDRFTCHACGQLLVGGDRVCSRCGARQWVPGWLRSGFRALGLSKVGPRAGTTLAAVTMLAGYLIQLRYFGMGAFMSGSDHGWGLLDLGVAVPELVKGHQPWRAFTYTLFHGGLMHLAFNLIALVQIGPAVERWFGFGRFWLSWTLTGIAAAAIPIALGLRTTGIVLGASGAVSGLIGMAAVFGHLQGGPQGLALRNGMLKWMLYVTVFGMLMGSVAHDAHFAGFGAGALLAWLLPPPGWKPRHGRFTPWITALGLALAIVPTAQFAITFLQPTERREEALFPEAARAPLVALREAPPKTEAALNGWYATFLSGTAQVGPTLQGRYRELVRERLPPEAWRIINAQSDARDPRHHLPQ